MVSPPEYATPADSGASHGRAVLGDELAELISLGSGEPLPAAGLPPVTDLVAEYAATDPNRVAVRCSGDAVSYAELQAWAGRIGARLAALGIGRDSRVGLVCEPSTAMVAAVLGILRSGAAYVPVDRGQPDQRVADVLHDARVACLVITADMRSRVADLGLPLLHAEDVRALDDAVPAPGGEVSASDPAYLIYTSGSTGEPKGVLVEHGQLSGATLARRLVYPGSPVFLLVSPLAFDSSVAGLWGTLTAGGVLITATTEEVRDPERLVELIDRHQVTRLLCVPSLYRVLLDAAERLGPHRLSTLDTVIVAGETLPMALVDRHFALHSRHSGSTVLVNEYGPTEATVWASYRWFDAPGPVSIGGPVPGARLYVLDDLLRPVPRGAEGELVIGGAGVSRGYFERPHATAQAFIDDPFAGRNGARMYRTGDRVRWNAAGELEFLGRRDHQVKIRGNRVELGTVEAALRALPGVIDAVVVTNAAVTQLTGFVLAAPDTAPDALRDRLVERLPAVMVPARIDVLESFPLTFSGKVDRARLGAAIEAGKAVSVPLRRPAEGDTVVSVAAAWAEVLEMPDIPADANFFDLGGHSLTMFQLQDALERHTGTRPSVVALFRYTTVTEQAALISGGGAEPGRALPDRRQAAAARAQAVRARRQRAAQENV